MGGEMIASFGSMDCAIEKLLWYDLDFHEHMQRYKVQLSKARGALLYKTLYVLDIGGWKADHLLPSLMKAVHLILVRGTVLSPNTLWRVYLVNVPWMFMLSWRLIQRWIHPVTLKKIRMYSSLDPFLADVTGELGLSMGDIPKDFGGHGHWMRDLRVTPVLEPL